MMCGNRILCAAAALLTLRLFACAWTGSRLVKVTLDPVDPWCGTVQRQEILFGDSYSGAAAASMLGEAVCLHYRQLG